MTQDNKWHMHELTDLLVQEIGQDIYTWKRRDGIIRNWLSRRREEICNLSPSLSQNDFDERINEILRLSPVEEPEKDIAEDLDVKYPVEDKVGEWCGHIQMPCGDGKPTFKGGVIVYEDWKCCPICGAKRPEKKSLAEKFMGVRSTHQPFSDFIDEIQADYLAKIATAHFHNEQNEG